MEPIIGHWLDPAPGVEEGTPNLGVRLEGLSRSRPQTRPASCPNCEGQLALFATYENSPFVRFSRFALIALELCPTCSRDTDGTAGGNGFFPRLVHPDLALSPAALPEPVYFRATPTDEPASEQEFRKWRAGVMRAKLGGRQMSIQPPLEANCEKCSSPFVFVSSIDESWAPSVLNFGGGFGYVFVCRSECSPNSTLFYWDCC